jgi:hypothetical protein
MLASARRRLIRCSGSFSACARIVRTVPLVNSFAGISAGSLDEMSVAAGDRGGRDSRVGQRVPGHLEQVALLRVHRLRLARANPEEVRVKTRHIVDESTPPAVRPSRGLRIGSEV